MPSVYSMFLESIAFISNVYCPIWLKLVEEIDTVTLPSWVITIVAYGGEPVVEQVLQTTVVVRPSKQNKSFTIVLAPSIMKLSLKIFDIAGFGADGWIQ